MNKVLVNCLFLLLISLPTFAQHTILRSPTAHWQEPVHASTKTLSSNNLASTTERVETKKIAPEGTNINILPLFGDFEKTDIQKNTDEIFLKSCDQNFDNRQEASQFFSARAWEYLSQSEIDTALYRFNLAWLLNKKNVDVYWGLGVISYQKEDLKKAVVFLENGYALDSTNATLTVDLATVKIQCFLKDKEAKDLQEANTLLHKSLEINPNFATAYMKLCLSQLAGGDYSEAWHYFHKGYDLDINSLDIDLLSALLERQDDPEGKFKKQ